MDRSQRRMKDFIKEEGCTWVIVVDPYVWRGRGAGGEGEVVPGAHAQEKLNFKR